MTYTAQIGQTLYDIALQLYGDHSAILWLCQDNAIELDADVMPGMDLKIRNDYKNKSIANYYKDNNITVCTS